MMISPLPPFYKLPECRLVIIVVPLQATLSPVGRIAGNVAPVLADR